MLHLRFLGVGNADAHGLGNASAVLEGQAGEPLLLIDCGPTVINAYRESYACLPGAIFITHTHFDHIGGLEGLFYKLACAESAQPRPRLYLPAAIIERLDSQLANDPFKLAEGGVNFWDPFQVVPVGDSFWHAGHRFDVFAVNHHGYRSAFGLSLARHFVFTGDTRPIPEVLARFAGQGETVFHDCALRANPSHTGVTDLAQNYPADLRNRLVLYHYESCEAAESLRAQGYRVAAPGVRFELSGAGETTLLRAV